MAVEKSKALAENDLKTEEGNAAPKQGTGPREQKADKTLEPALGAEEAEKEEPEAKRPRNIFSKRAACEPCGFERGAVSGLCECRCTCICQEIAATWGKENGEEDEEE